MAAVPNSGFYYALASIPLMGAGVFGPDVFHLSLEAKTIAFYGCLGLATLCVVIGVRKELRAEAGASVTRGHRRRIIVMAISLAVFGVGVAWYFWPMRPHLPGSSVATTTPVTEPKRPWKHSLEELYTSDFPDLGNMQRIITFSDPNSQVKIIEITFRLYQDFHSNAEFVSIFFPASQNIHITNKIFGIIKYLRDEIPTQRDQLHNEIGVGMTAPGVPYTDTKDMRFSGRVIVYTMQAFTDIQRGELGSWYQATNLSLQIRGLDYWLANRDR
jgi:hypothetical protein